MAAPALRRERAGGAGLSAPRPGPTPCPARALVAGLAGTTLLGPKVRGPKAPRNQGPRPEASQSLAQIGGFVPSMASRAQKL